VHTRLSKVWLAPLVAIAALWPVAVAPSPACAAETPRAALVVDTGNDVLTYCVALPDGSVSGMELIELASQQHGLSYKLGFAGEAVCMLAGVGPTGSDCFAEDPDFWAYWRETESGGWTWSSSGATATVVENGDVEGWAWGSGTGPDTHPAPPTTKFGAVCVAQERPEENEPRESRPSPSPDPVAGSSPSADEDDSAADESEPRKGRGKELAGDRERDEKQTRSERTGDEEYEVAIATPSPSPAPRAAPVELASDEGPPLAGIVAVAATVGLGVAGGVVARRRRGAR
jgi:hypothetical protein